MTVDATPGHPCAVEHRAAALRLSLSTVNHTYRAAVRSRYISIHFLTIDDVPLAERLDPRAQLSCPGPMRFADP